MKKLITFYEGIDIRARQQPWPTVARLRVEGDTYRYIVIGTEYGYLHTSGGDVRTWKSHSGAKRAANNYVPF